MRTASSCGRRFSRLNRTSRSSPESPGCGFVQYENSRLERQRQGDLDKAAPPVGELRHFRASGVDETRLAQDPLRLAQHVVLAAHFAPRLPVPRHAGTHPQPDVLRDAQLREQRTNLESPNNPQAHALLDRRARDLLIAQIYRARIRPQQTTDQVDERGLAGPIWTDQGMASALLQRQANVSGDLQGSKALVDLVKAQDG